MFSLALSPSPYRGTHVNHSISRPKFVQFENRKISVAEPNKYRWATVGGKDGKCGEKKSH